MRPKCRNRFIKGSFQLGRTDHLLQVSWLILGTTFSDLPFFPSLSEFGCNDQPCTRQIGGKTRAHDELRPASRPFQFLGQNTVKHGWQPERSTRMGRGDTPSARE